MVEQWFMAIGSALGKMFYTPIFYWVILLLSIASIRRIKRERQNFGTKVFRLFAEIQKTFLISLVFGIVVSTISILFGFVLTWEIIIVLSLITVLLTLNSSFQFLSATYTVGITLAAIIILAHVPLPSEVTQWLTFTSITTAHLLTLALLMAFLLFAEAMLMITTNERQTFPKLVKSSRGLWIGEHELKRMAIIPVFTFVPMNDVTMVAPFFPAFEFGMESYQLILIPFVTGFQYPIRGMKVKDALKYLTTEKLLQTFIVIALAIVSFYVPILVVLVAIVAILLNEWFTFRYRAREVNRTPYYAPANEGVKVLGVVPGSRAAELGIIPGETVIRVNGKTVYNTLEFYEALQRSGAFVKLDIVNLDGEVRFLQSAKYEVDLHDLGLLFPEPPLKQLQRKRAEEIRSML